VPNLTVYIDFKSPYAYLAIEPTRRLAKELQIEVDWYPFVLDIPSYLGNMLITTVAATPTCAA
jgi:2-hydroxychromene-2-carboxylate isomerase